MKRKTDNQPLMLDLVLLSDAFTQHASMSGFLLAALTSVMADEPQPEIVEGARLTARMFQSRTVELQQKLDQVCARYRTEHATGDSDSK